MTSILLFALLLKKIFTFIVVIGALVLVHEFGHFIVAKWCGVGVLKFAVGFGPPIVRWRRGETVYQIGWIPLGGFVRMVGDIPDMLTGPQVTDEAVRGKTEPKKPEKPKDPRVLEEERIAAELFADKSRWFIEKGFWAKSSIVVAGPIFNFIFAFAVAAFCGLIYGEEVSVEGAVIGDIIKGSPGEAAGLKEGDQVLSVNGAAISRWEEFAKKIHYSEGLPLALGIQRGNESLQLTATPHPRPVFSAPKPEGEGTAEQPAEKKISKLYFLGLSPATKHLDLGVGGSLHYGIRWTYEKTFLTYYGLYEMFAGRASTKDLAGPIFIFQEAGRQADRGYESLLYFMAIISVSLAVLNLLPVPVLDGGHLMFFIIEAILGPISIRKKEFAQQLGMLLLLSLMAFAIKNDVSRPTHKEPDWNTVKDVDKQMLEKYGPGQTALEATPAPSAAPTPK